jgi:polyhydroxybutyrate depolymerase
MVKWMPFLTALFFVVVMFACRDSGAGEATPSPVGPIVAGATTGTLRAGGLDRTYRLFVPPAVASDPAKRVPLVVGLHGGLGTGEQFARTTRFDTMAVNGGFIAAYPDGVDRTWNGGGCCGAAVRRGIDDVAFLAGLIDALTRQLPVDPARVFVTGHSNGGIMAFRLACERADVVLAIAPVAGSLEIRSCQPSRAVSLLAIHGDSDRNHPAEGGAGSRSIAGVAFTSMADSLERWSGAMGCPGAPQATVAGALTTTDWRPCRDGAVARYVLIAGADHPWPGGVPGATAIQGETSTALDATAAVWAFFSSLPGR